MTILKKISAFLRLSSTTADGAIPAEESTLQEAVADQPKSPSGHDIIINPTVFARWIFDNLVSKLDYESAKQLGPIAEDVEQLQITAEELHLAAQELMLMYAVGPSLFISRNATFDYYSEFLQEISVCLSRSMFGTHLENRVRDIKQSIESYVAAFVESNDDSQGFDRFASLYEERVFTNNPNSLYIKLSATLPKQAADFVFHSFDISRDSYYQLDTGLTYKQFEAVETAFSKRGFENSSQQSSAGA
jgi:hypothetical protein